MVAAAVDEVGSAHSGKRLLELLEGHAPSQDTGPPDEAEERHTAVC